MSRPTVARVALLLACATLGAGSSAAARVPSPGTARADTTPPADVSELLATIDDRAITLTWRSPADVDFDHVEIVRSGGGSGASALVYRGGAEIFRDRRLVNGFAYRYRVVTVDGAGNRSVGNFVTVRPHAPVIVAPAAGTRVARPPLLAWSPDARAAYYNVQLFRQGQRVLSVWPRRSRLQLPREWTFSGRSYRLSPGLYRWYVWPGVGAPREARYGTVLVQSSFVVVH